MKNLYISGFMLACITGFLSANGMQLQLIESLYNLENSLRSINQISQAAENLQSAVPFTFEQARKREQELSQENLLESNRSEFKRDLPRIRDAYLKEAQAVLKTKDKKRMLQIKSVLTAFDDFVRNRVALEADFKYRPEYKVPIQDIVKLLDIEIFNIEYQELNELKKKAPFSYEDATNILEKLYARYAPEKDIQHSNILYDEILNLIWDSLEQKIDDEGITVRQLETSNDLLKINMLIKQTIKLKTLAEKIGYKHIIKLAQMGIRILKEKIDLYNQKIKAAEEKSEQEKEDAKLQKEEAEIAQKLGVAVPLYSEVLGQKLLIDPAAILGFSAGEFPDDLNKIKKKFNKLALKWHPDKNPDKRDFAEKVFKVISEARDMLLANLPK